MSPVKGIDPVLAEAEIIKVKDLENNEPGDAMKVKELDRKEVGDMLKVKDLGRMEADNIDSTALQSRDDDTEDENENGKVFPGKKNISDKLNDHMNLKLGLFCSCMYTFFCK